MPSIENIMQVAEALEKSPVLVVADRCVAVRNRNASCRRCVSACPDAAISVAANQVSIDPTQCVGCGACCAACPTEALVPLKPTHAELQADAAESMRRNGGRVVIACARIASKRQADPESYAEVGCLSRMDEALVTYLAAQGADSILLVDGNCETCKYGKHMAAATEAIENAHRLLEIHGSPLRVARVTGFPEEMRQERGEGTYGSSRRGFFSDALGVAKDTAKIAAKAAIENELGYKIDELSIGERLRVDSDGRMPRLSMKRHEEVLNALDAIGQPGEGVISSRLFGSVDIDTSKCNACSMCVTFCPTGALKRDQPAKPSARIRYLEFSAADCVQCGLCKDVCWKGAIELSCEVDAAELYDFEPAVYKIGA